MADTLTIPSEGKIFFNDALVNSENIRIALFVNDATVSASSTVSDFTQMSTHGITHKDLAMSSWPTSTINGSSQGSSTYAAQEFVATSADDGTATDVYGYIAYSVTTSKLLWVVKFDSAKPITYEDEKITVTPEMLFTQGS